MCNVLIELNRKQCDMLHKVSTTVMNFFSEIGYATVTFFGLSLVKR